MARLAPLADRDFMTIPETAARMGVSADCLYERHRRGELDFPVVTVGSLLRVPKLAYERWHEALAERVPS